MAEAFAPVALQQVAPSSPSSSARRVIDFVAAWDALAPRLAPAAGSSGEGALRLLLGALKLATPALSAAGLHPTGAPRASRALAIAAALAEQGADAETVAAGMLAEAVEARALSLADVQVAPPAPCLLAAWPLPLSGWANPQAALGLPVAALVHDVAGVRDLPGRASPNLNLDDAGAAALRTFCLAFHDVRAVLPPLGPAPAATRPPPLLRCPAPQAGSRALLGCGSHSATRTRPALQLR